MVEKPRVPRKPTDDDVIPLSRWRAALARARTSRRADTLLELPDADKVVPTLPVQDLYYLVKEVGLHDAHELLALASPAQLRGFLDFDVWERDKLALPRAAEWIDALIDLGPDKLGAAVRALDVEMPSLWLAKHAQVYDLSLGEAPPEDTEHELWPSPDRFFLVEITAEGAAARTTERFLDHLYRSDPELGRRVLMGARWELPTELEETSYRWRSGRLADLGFVDYYEALEIYKYLDPQSVRVGEDTARSQPPVAEGEPGSTLPAPLAGAMGESFFQHAMTELAGKDPDEAGRVSQNLVTLANQVMAADRIEPADLEGVRNALERALGYLSMGLEYVSRGDLGHAEEALRSIALVRLFRVGVSLTLQLGKLAQTLQKRAGQLEHPWDDLVSALAERVPRLHLPEEQVARHFRSVAEIRQAAKLLEQAAATIQRPKN